MLPAPLSSSCPQTGKRRPSRPSSRLLEIRNRLSASGRYKPHSPLVGLLLPLPLWHSSSAFLDSFSCPFLTKHNRKRVVMAKIVYISVDLGGRRIFTKKKN